MSTPSDTGSMQPSKPRAASSAPFETPRPPVRLFTVVGRALRRRCPACGEGKIFQSRFLVHTRCSNCGFHFDRGAGYWLGAIYVNYGLTAVIVTTAYLALFFTDALPPNAILWLLTGFTILFPLWSFQYARSLWLALDLYFDPQQTGESESNYPRGPDGKKPSAAD